MKNHIYKKIILTRKAYSTKLLTLTIQQI